MSESNQEELTVVETLNEVDVVRRTGGHSTECIISAHGIQPWVNHKFKVPDDMMVVFYAPHGYTMSADTTLMMEHDLTVHKVKGNLLEPNTLPIMRREKAPKEEKNPQDCQDYNLSRFQETGGIESQNSLQRLATERDAEYRRLRNIGETRPSPEIDKQIEKYEKWMDIVIIQENKDVALSKVLQQLKPLNYKRVHCSFCRGGPFRDKGSYDTIKPGGGLNKK
jgi:hypothetical protein